MDYDGPTFTDSGGFQIFSLGIAYKKGIDVVAHTQKGNAAQAVKSPMLQYSPFEEGVPYLSKSPMELHEV